MAAWTAALRLAPADPRELREDGKVLRHGEAWIEGDFLRNPADGAPCLALTERIGTGDPHGAALQRQSSGHDAHERTLAGAVRAEQGEGFASLDPAIDAPQDPMPAIGEDGAPNHDQGLLSRIHEWRGQRGGRARTRRTRRARPGSRTTTRARAKSGRARAASPEKP